MKAVSKEEKYIKVCDKINFLQRKIEVLEIEKKQLEMEMKNENNK